MIISFSIENWMSFKDKATLSMVGSREQQHNDRVPRVGASKIKVLPTAAIFGGNASGKSNFLAALDFAKRLVVEGVSTNQVIPVEPFLLDGESEKRPSSFAFELVIGEGIYEYSFKVTRTKVLEERLVKINSKSEKELFSRSGDAFVFGGAQSKNQRLKFVAEGTRDNQLFLTNSVSQKIDVFRHIYDWFYDSLIFISPVAYFTRFEQFMDEGQPLNSLLSQALSAMDTGIDGLGGVEIPLETLPQSEYLKDSPIADLNEGESAKLRSLSDNASIIVTRKSGKLSAQKMVSYHAKADGSRARLEMRQESDGTRRVIDLLPAFLCMVPAGSTKVIVIDELDRSLHTTLTQSLLRYYFSTCSKDTRAQLLFTTHDVMLMDQSLMRRDEMWVTERDGYGASSLTSLLEYEDIRVDTDIRKAYLHGRLGGVPNVLMDSFSSGLAWQNSSGA